jgi:transcriptional regulator with XRE-family HTH domain
MIRFNERFKEAREYFGMNKADFAKKLKISATTVARYESGSMDIAMGSINDVAEKLGIRLEWLLGLSDNMYDTDLEYRNIPILKTVIGKSVFCMENYEGFEILKSDYEVDFCVKVKDPSGAVPDKTYFFKRQGNADDGDTVAVVNMGEVLVSVCFKVQGKPFYAPIDGKGKAFMYDIGTVIGRAVYELSEVKDVKLQEAR